MNPVEQDILGRKAEIISEVNVLFNANMKFTAWDVPEVDNELAGKIIIEIMQGALDMLKTELSEGKFKN